MGYFTNVIEFEKQRRKVELIMGAKMNTKERVEYLEKRIDDATKRIEELEAKLPQDEKINLFEEHISYFITPDCNGEKFKFSQDYEWVLTVDDDGVWYAKPTKKCE